MLLLFFVDFSLDCRGDCLVYAIIRLYSSHDIMGKNFDLQVPVIVVNYTWTIETNFDWEASHGQIPVATCDVAFGDYDNGIKLFKNKKLI